MYMIVLTDASDGRDVWINTHQLQAMYTSGSKVNPTTTLVMHNHLVIVKETLETIHYKMSGRTN
jgi:uncharacterized protein YlzI (FlbEa/FlbD family)